MKTIKILLLFSSLFITTAIFAQEPPPPPSSGGTGAGLPLDSEVFLPILLATGAVALLLKRKNKS